ncbi:putative RNA-directed DNA polymerase [Helianthus anomalus]
MTTIRLVLSIVAAEKLHLEQLDVKTAFLHGDLNEDIYMAQPEGFKVVGKENWVCKLKKSLYGLKQAPRQWYMKFDNFMERSGYKRCQMDHCCYLKKFSNSYIILLLYVDDMLIAGSDMKEISRLKKQMSKEFEMKDLGPAKQILGMSITRSKKDGSVTLSQEKYIGKVLERFGMNSEKTKPRNTPLGSHLKLTKEQCPRTEEEKADMARVPYASAVGSLMYAMVCTRPDIAHADEGRTLRKQFATFHMKKGIYSRIATQADAVTMDGIDWWATYRSETPELAEAAKKYSPNRLVTLRRREWGVHTPISYVGL